MSNLNENDTEYVEKFDKLFEVETVTIEDYNENGDLTDVKNWWSVTNRLIPEHSYPCRNKETAEELCDYLNIVCDEYDLTTKSIEEINTTFVPSALIRLANRINEKLELLEQYQIAKTHELSFELDYLHKCNEVKLNPEIVKTELELSKNPTEKQITAYCEEKYLIEYQNLAVAKAKVGLLGKQLAILDDMISFNKYCVRMELKK